MLTAMQTSVSVYVLAWVGLSQSRYSPVYIAMCDEITLHQVTLNLYPTEQESLTCNSVKQLYSARYIMAPLQYQDCDYMLCVCVY